MGDITWVVVRLCSSLAIFSPPDNVSIGLARTWISQLTQNISATDSIAPYRLSQIVQMLREEKVIDGSLTDEAAYSNYKGAVDRGISKIMAKMGISTLQSYKGAQVQYYRFRAIKTSHDI